MLVSFRSVLRRVARGHGQAVQWVVNYPILLIAVAGLYVLTSRGAAWVSKLLSTVVAGILIWSGRLQAGSNGFLQYEIALWLFFILTILIWCHFLYMAFKSFRAAAQIRMTAIGVAQLVASTVFIFAAVHYYVALFSDGPSYGGTLNLPSPEGDDVDDRIFYLPGWDVVIDFVYFSAVTTATVGYGDIYPTSWLARLVTTFQIGMSFVLVAVVLASVVGPKESRDGSEGSDHKS